MEQQTSVSIIIRIIKYASTGVIAAIISWLTFSQQPLVHEALMLAVSVSLTQALVDIIVHSAI